MLSRQRNFSPCFMSLLSYICERVIGRRASLHRLGKFQAPLQPHGVLDMRTSSGVRSSEKAVLLAASVGYVSEVLGAEGASIVAAIVLVEACCLA